MNSKHSCYDCAWECLDGCCMRLDDNGNREPVYDGLTDCPMFTLSIESKDDHDETITKESISGCSNLKKALIASNAITIVTGITGRSEVIRDYTELEAKLIYLTGCDMEKLIELFAAGYTLQPPKHMSLDDTINANIADAVKKTLNNTEKEKNYD